VDENAYARARPRTTQKIATGGVGFEVVEKQADALQVLQRAQILEQVGVTAHDEPPLVLLSARPAGEPGCHDLLRELVELRLAPHEGDLEIGLGLGKRASPDACVEEIGG